MIYLITGASHTGKTRLAQHMLEIYKIPYLSIDYLKMGLIRSGQTKVTVYDDEQLTEYLWPIVREIIKTAIENEQFLIVEGCYIPFDWQKDFTSDNLEHIQYCCLVFSEDYIRHHFEDIIKYENVIEKRLSCEISMEELIQENQYNLAMCKQYGCRYHLIDETYEIGDIWA